jgi:Flp pilus assembly protein CpaB
VSKRSTLLIVIGVAVFVVGTGLVLVSLKGHPAKSTTAAQFTSANGMPLQVVVANSAIPAGTTGESLIQSKQVSLKTVPSKDYSSDDLTSFSSLANDSLVHPITAGTPIQSSDLQQATGAIPAPSGDETMALTLNTSAAALAGYLVPGDNVDVFANVTKTTQGPGTASLPTPCVTLVAPHVEVLDVSDVVPAYRGTQQANGRVAPGSETILVAISPAQAKTLVFYTSFEQLYLVGSQTTQSATDSTCYGLTNSPALVPVP